MANDSDDASYCTLEQWRGGHKRAIQFCMGLRNFVKFSILVGFLGILSDAILGHALLWENDPYWTYWITKTFLIASVFAIGTAWLGVGVGRGAVITLIHTIVLTVYYWTFSPIGLPDDPEWLDLTHTWITGVPIHFAVIYIGYLVALWMWRKSDAGDIDYVGARPLVNSALIAALIVVILSGLLGSWALGQFVGATWFVTRLLIVFMFFLFCFAYIPQSGSGIVMGSLTLALILTAYSHYLGPLGLPGEWRLFENFTPHTEPYWLNYQELWLKQFPIYLITSMLGLWAVKFRISKILGKL